MDKKFYDALKEKSDFRDAYLFIKNSYSRNPSDKVIFQEYINYTLEIATYDLEFDIRKNYINEAYSALTIFSESAEITEETLNLIKQTSDALATCLNKLCEEEREFLNKKYQEFDVENTKLLNTLTDINISLNKVTSQDEFDKLLKEVAEIETKLNKEFFSDKQEKTYNNLTQSYSKTISEKMEELNQIRLLETNKKAISAFKYVMKQFNSDKSKYKTEGNLRSLVTSYLFVYDTRDLFNESLVYYNHVYSYIFNEVNEELKYKLTEWSINTSKRR